jgi:hypothetical protein
VRSLSSAGSSTDGISSQVASQPPLRLPTHENRPARMRRYVPSPVSSSAKRMPLYLATSVAPCYTFRFEITPSWASSVKL